MKHLLLAATLLLASFGAAAQTWVNPLPIDSSTRKVSYVGVVPVEGATADQLYTRARAWFATEFTAANAVLQMDDRAAGSLIGKGNTTISFRASGMLVQPVMSFRLSVLVKDGRYRYELTDVASESGGVQVPGVYIKPSTIPVEGPMASSAHYDRKGHIKPGVAVYYTTLDSGLKSIAARLEAAMAKQLNDW